MECFAKRCDKHRIGLGASPASWNNVPSAATKRNCQREENGDLALLAINNQFAIAKPTGEVPRQIRIYSKMYALKQALHDRRPAHRGGLIHHSDRGSQYVSVKYTERLAQASLEPSVGSVGNSYDNTLVETSNGLYKAEVIYRCGPWRSFEAVEFTTLEWFDWFNDKRLLEPIGNIPPAEAEQIYYAMLDNVPMAA